MDALMEDVAPAISLDLDASPVGRAVSRLRDIARHHALRLAYDVGRIVREDLFEGDLEAFSRRSEAPWMKALAAHPELPFAGVVLSRSCSVYELMARLGLGIEDTTLTLSHFRAVLRLGAQAGELQHELLTQAQREGWTSDQLADRVAGVGPPGRFGRRPQHAAKKAIAALGRLVEGKLAALTEGAVTLDDLPPEEVPELLEVLTAAEDGLSALRGRLEARRGPPEPPDLTEGPPL